MTVQGNSKMLVCFTDGAMQWAYGDTDDGLAKAFADIKALGGFHPCQDPDRVLGLINSNDCSIAVSHRFKDRSLERVFLIKSGDVISIRLVDSDAITLIKPSAYAGSRRLADDLASAIDQLTAGLNQDTAQLRADARSMTRDINAAMRGMSSAARDLQTVWRDAHVPAPKPEPRRERVPTAFDRIVNNMKKLVFKDKSKEQTSDAKGTQPDCGRGSDQA